MADKYTETKILGIGIRNKNGYDEDNPAKTQYIKIPNPKDTLTEQQIKTAVQVGLTAELYIDDKGQTYSSDSKIVTAYTEYQSITAVDIGVE